MQTQIWTIFNISMKSSYKSGHSKGNHVFSHYSTEVLHTCIAFLGWGWGGVRDCVCLFTCTKTGIKRLMARPEKFYKQKLITKM